MMRDPEQTIGNLIDHQNASFIGSVDEEGFPEIKAMLPPRRREGIRTDRYTPWYAAGCEWAKANGISDGSNPEAPVTREQFAAMLYRYAALKGRNLTAGENLNFTDASDVSAYALPALQWATGEKILTGSNGALNPQATATRAHLAAILHRYFG